MPPFPGFVGPAYQSACVVADAEDLINLYAERIESGKGKNAVYYRPTPGLKQFAGSLAAADNPIRAMLEHNGRTFALGATNLVELLPDGTATGRGTLQIADRSAGPASITGSGDQLAFCSNGTLYTFDLVINNLDIPAGLQGPVAKVGYLDGYCVSLLADQRRFQISDLLQFKSWDPIEISAVNYMPDDILTMVIDHRQVWFFGRTNTLVYYNSGNPDFPVDPIAGGVLQRGILAPESACKLADGIAWLGGDSRGGPRVLLARSLAPPEPISNHALEYAMGRYSRIDDAIGFSYIQDGHEFYCLIFPEAQAGWMFDVSTGWWNKWLHWDQATAAYQAPLARCHCYAFGKHLIGARNSSKIFELMYSGTVDPAAEPKIMLSYSNDGGRTWGPEQLISVGKLGEYATRAVAHRLGSGRDRVFRLAVMDSVLTDDGAAIRRLRTAPHLNSENKRIFYHDIEFDLEAGSGYWRLVNAYLNFTVGAH